MMVMSRPHFKGAHPLEQHPILLSAPRVVVVYETLHTKPVKDGR